MIIPIVRAALLSFAAFMVSLTLAQGGRIAGSPLHQVFSANCSFGDARPCFMGIRIGETSMVEARALLETHDWVTDIDLRMTMDLFGIEHLRFRWRNPASPVSDPLWQGELSASYNIVQLIRLEAELSFGEMWVALGEPPIVAYSGTPSRRAPIVLLYNSFSQEHSARAISTIPCPLSVRNFLFGEVMTQELREREDAASPEQILPSPLSLLQALRNSRPMC